MVPTVQSLLPEVRKWVLIYAANGRSGFGLSFIVQQLSPKLYSNTWQGPPVGDTIRNRFTSCGLKTHRGKIQAALSVLAKEGLMFSRQHTECNVAPYAHCETDKRFRIRITQKEAIKRLAKYKS